MVGLDGDDIVRSPHARFPDREQDLVPEDVHAVSYPGTKYHADLEARPDPSHDLRRYDYGARSFTANMTAEEMITGLRTSIRDSTRSARSPDASGHRGATLLETAFAAYAVAT